MEFDKDLFISICKDYGVEFSNEYDEPMMRDYDGELKPFSVIFGVIEQDGGEIR